MAGLSQNSGATDCVIRNLDQKIHGQGDRGIKCIAGTVWIDAISTSNMAGVFVLINDKVEMENDPTSAVAKFQTYNKISLEQKNT